MYLLIYSFENIFCFIFCSGSPEAEAGVSCVRQEVFRPETTHQAGARGTQGDQQIGGNNPTKSLEYGSLKVNLKSMGISGTVMFLF